MLPLSLPELIYKYLFWWKSWRFQKSQQRNTIRLKKGPDKLMKMIRLRWGWEIFWRKAWYRVPERWLQEQSSSFRFLSEMKSTFIIIKSKHFEHVELGFWFECGNYYKQVKIYKKRFEMFGLGYKNVLIKFGLLFGRNGLFFGSKDKSSIKRWGLLGN